MLSEYTDINGYFCKCTYEKYLIDTIGCVCVCVLNNNRDHKFWRKMRDIKELEGEGRVGVM